VVEFVVIERREWRLVLALGDQAAEFIGVDVLAPAAQPIRAHLATHILGREGRRR
jgi:hypothetical protein